MILAKKTFYIETIIFPLTITLILILSNSSTSGVNNMIAYVALLSMYGILQNMISGSARSIEKEIYQDTLSLHFLSNTSLWLIVFNKMLANGLVGILNLGIVVSMSAIFFPIEIFAPAYLLAGFSLMLICSLILSMTLSIIFLRGKNTYAISSIVVRVSLLFTGIIIPIAAFPTWALSIISLTGLPQVFSLIIYGLNGTEIISYFYMLLLPPILLLQLIFSVRMFNQIECKYMMKGGI